MPGSPVKPSQIGTPLTQRAAAERRQQQQQSRRAAAADDEAGTRYTGISLTRVLALLALILCVLGVVAFPLLLVGLALIPVVVLMSYRSKAYRS